MNIQQEFSAQRRHFNQLLFSPGNMNAQLWLCRKSFFFNTFTILKTWLILILLLPGSAALAQEKFKPVTEIPEGKALVYIYRPGSMMGALVNYTVRVDEDKVSEDHLWTGQYLVHFATPGTHRYWGQTTTKIREMFLQVEAGKTYYIRASCCDFIIPTQEKAQKDIAKCSLAGSKKGKNSSRGTD
jgi:hypothetical protein